ncbi:MAG: hypothetical protein ACLPPV_03670 [Candidatus Korobacteraceae bacterium]|jgi:hypothetical protein
MPVAQLIYHIVKIGEAPGNDGYPYERATCAEWSSLEDKAEKEVIAVDLATKQVMRRYSAAEAEQIANNWRNPEVR